MKSDFKRKYESQDKIIDLSWIKTAFLEDLVAILVENDQEEDIYEGNDDEQDGEDN